MLSAETTRIERRIRSRGTILTQMRNSLSRHTINNRDKGFMVARETAAIKVSGCFQSVNSRCHKVGARPGVASRHPLPTAAGARRFRLSQISTTAMDCICVHVCYIYSRCSLAITVLDVFRAGTRCCYVRKKCYANRTLLSFSSLRSSNLFDFCNYTYALAINTIS